MSMGMKLAGFWSGLDWDTWAYSLIKGAISAGAGAVNSAFAALVIDPKDFAFGSEKSLHLIGWTFLFGVMTFTFAFLSKSGLPEAKKRVETVEISQKGDQPPTVIKTTKDTSMVAIDEPIKPPPSSTGTGTGTGSGTGH